MFIRSIIITVSCEWSYLKSLQRRHDAPRLITYYSVYFWCALSFSVVSLCSILSTNRVLSRLSKVCGKVISSVLYCSSPTGKCIHFILKCRIFFLKSVKEDVKYHLKPLLLSLNKRPPSLWCLLFISHLNLLHKCLFFIARNHATFTCSRFRSDPMNKRWESSMTQKWADSFTF